MESNGTGPDEVEPNQAEPGDAVLKADNRPNDPVAGTDETVVPNVANHPRKLDTHNGKLDTHKVPQRFTYYVPGHAGCIVVERLLLSSTNFNNNNPTNLFPSPIKSRCQPKTNGITTIRCFQVTGRTRTFYCFLKINQSRVNV